MRPSLIRILPAHGLYYGLPLDHWLPLSHFFAARVWENKWFSCFFCILPRKHLYVCVTTARIPGNSLISILKIISSVFSCHPPSLLWMMQTLAIAHAHPPLFSLSPSFIEYSLQQSRHRGGASLFKQKESQEVKKKKIPLIHFFPKDH